MKPTEIILGCVMSLVLVAQSPGAEPTTAPANRPDGFKVNIDDVSVHMSGPDCLWTLKGFEYKNSMMATQDSAYGTVIGIRGVGLLGSGHFLDIPGKLGEVEKEDVHELHFFLDGKPVEPENKSTLSGKSFRMDRTSNIRNFAVTSHLEVRDNVIIETSRIQSEQTVDLDMTFPLMYAWTAAATEFVFGLEDGTTKQGTFMPGTQKPGEGLEKTARWMAIYDPIGKRVGVAVLRERPKDADAWFQYTDAPGIYRKLRILSF